MAVGSIGAVLATVALSWVLLGGGAARAAGTGSGPCIPPAGARTVASVAGVRVWWQSVPTPVSLRRQYGRATYPRYSGCASGHGPQVLFRDYSGDAVVVRVAGNYVGLRDRGGMEALYLSNLLTGRTTSTRSFTPSVQDNGGSEAYEPGPLLAWRVASSGWLVYLDTLPDAEGFGKALVAFSSSGATTLDLVSLTQKIGRLVVRGKTVSWWSSFSGARRATLGQALLPSALPKPLPKACQLVPRSLVRKLLGPLSATTPPPPQVPPADFWPRVGTGTDRSGCAYAAAADRTQTLTVAEQRVAPAIVSNQQRASNKTPRADTALALPGIAAVLGSRPNFYFFHPSGPIDLRLFIHGVEVDVTTNSDPAAREIEAAGLAIEHALHDVPPAGSHA